MLRYFNNLLTMQNKPKLSGLWSCHLGRILSIFCKNVLSFELNYRENLIDQKN